MKTPDEIKKGLECRRTQTCDWAGYPYRCFSFGASNSASTSCLTESSRDALEYIEQLERERDAALNDVSLFPECGTCKYDPRKKGYIPNDCDDCVGHCNWVWRGVKEEPHARD